MHLSKRKRKVVFLDRDGTVNVDFGDGGITVNSDDGVKVELGRGGIVIHVLLSVDPLLRCVIIFTRVNIYSTICTEHLLQLIMSCDTRALWTRVLSTLCLISPVASTILKWSTQVVSPDTTKFL